MADEEIRKQGLDAFQVGHFHDEFTYESSLEHAEKVAIILKRSIIRAGEYFNLRCPLDGDAKIGKTWADIH